MAAGNSVIAPERTLVTTRIFDAPRESVYKAWTDPKQLANWFPPEGFSSPRCEIDPRPGGVFRVDMQGPQTPPFDGKVFPGPGRFVEVVPNERLVFTMTPGPVDLLHLSQWWTWTTGACWKAPEGPGSSTRSLWMPGATP